MCKSSKPKTPEAPKPRPPQVLRNPLLDRQSRLANLGIGALTIRTGESPSFTASGAIEPMARPDLIPTGGSQGTGKFITPTYGASNRAAAVAKKRASDKAAQAKARKEALGGRKKWADDNARGAR